ncbi:MAG: putative glycoside hydrolase [Candidatus Magasanikiibacteriota bacterium]
MKIFKSIVSLLVFGGLLNFVLPSQVFASVNYPKKANYFLKWHLTDTEAVQLSKWDLVVLDMENQVTSPHLIKKMRQLNSDIIILAYITPQEIFQTAANSSGQLRRKLSVGLNNSWYLKNSQGDILSYWPGTYMLNITDNCPQINGKKLNEYMAEFVTNNILSTNLWDGVFYDNAWSEMGWALGNNIDTNNDGKIDNNPNAVWQKGMRDLYTRTRELSKGDIIIVGNAATDIYRNELNGNMIESFNVNEWAEKMNIYKNNNDSDGNFNVVNVNTGNTNKNQDYKKMRLGLSSTLLENGFYSFDYGNQDHGQTWWYDEYDINLGQPTGQAISKSGYKTYKKDLWKRDFSNGLVLVNSTEQTQKVSLGGDYEKIHGLQDKIVNDGSIISEVNISANDGLLLLKTFNKLDNVLYRNGSFVRFFDKDGNRVRNGFFAFDEAYKGGEQIAKVDLDGNGKSDLLVVGKNKVMAWRDDGQLYMKVYPYGAMYQGELKIAIGDLNKDKMLEVYVAPGVGYNLPIKIYTRHGRQMKQDWYPYGLNYTGGYSMAVGHITGSQKNDLVIAKASSEPMLTIFDYNYNMAYQWLVFSKQTKVGLNVAVGDVDGDTIGEIIVGAGSGFTPTVRLFDKTGKQLSEFQAYTSFDKPGVEVIAGDIDYDGKDDIITLSNGF